MIYQLKNTIQNYDWGSTNLLSDLFGIKNPDSKPQAELWMGAHYKGCSTVVYDHCEKKLSELISENPITTLGKTVYDKFGGLPFLLKILAIDKPLSIQVHPTKEVAIEGFEKENILGIPLSAKHRNYKDKNHKPELILAITKFKAMNGFRPIEEIITLFDLVKIPVLKNVLANFKENPNSQGLSNFFKFIFSLKDNELSTSISALLNGLKAKSNNQTSKKAFNVILECAEHFPEDIGLFAPLLLNIVELEPGEAMFLHAQTPHAYLKGCGVEVMANSDNVLRAGLTVKHIDVNELLKNLKYQSSDLSSIKSKFTIDNQRKIFSVPVDEFGLEHIDFNQSMSLKSDGAEIILCLRGQVYIETDHQTIHIKIGESAFIDAMTKNYQLVGKKASIVRAFCPISQS